MSCSISNPLDRRTDLNVPLEYLTNVIKKKCIAFVLSDFISAPYERALKLAAKRHDVIGMHVHDPAEAMLPDAGIVRMRDPESGRLMIVDTSDLKVAAAFSNAYRSRINQFNEQFKRAQCDTMSLSTDQSYITELHRFFKSRAQGMKTIWITLALCFPLACAGQAVLSVDKTEIRIGDQIKATITTNLSGGREWINADACWPDSLKGLEVVNGPHGTGIALMQLQQHGPLLFSIPESYASLLYNSCFNSKANQTPS